MSRQWDMTGISLCAASLYDGKHLAYPELTEIADVHVTCTTFLQVWDVTLADGSCVMV
jgi:hypothetical protein